MRKKETNPQDPLNNPERIGSLTASESKRALLMTKAGKPPSTADAYASDLVDQRIKGRIEPKWTPGYEPKPVKRGWRDEPYALAAWEDRHGVECQYRDFKLHESIQYFGASPDSVFEDCLIEVKSQGPTRHIPSLTRDEIAPEYQLQMNIQLLCWRDEGFKRVIFLSFDSDYPFPGQRLAEIVYEPKEEVLLKLEEDAINFLTTVNEIEKIVRNKKDESNRFKWAGRKRSGNKNPGR